MLAKPRLKRDLVSLKLNLNSDREILCNEIEIEQVILNLINNSIDAVKHLEDKWIKLSLVERPETLELHVIDSGAGISKGDVAKIFTPFFTTKKPGEGTGLGLSIISGILDDHDASIRYEQNAPNTTFIISFPFKQS